MKTLKIKNMSKLCAGQEQAEKHQLALLEWFQHNCSPAWVVKLLELSLKNQDWKVGRDPIRILWSVGG